MSKYDNSICNNKKVLQKLSFHTTRYTQNNCKYLDIYFAPSSKSNDFQHTDQLLIVANGNILKWQEDYYEWLLTGN